MQHPLGNGPAPDVAPVGGPKSHVAACVESGSEGFGVELRPRTRTVSLPRPSATPARESGAAWPDGRRPARKAGVLRLPSKCVASGRAGGAGMLKRAGLIAALLAAVVSVLWALSRPALGQLPTRHAAVPSAVIVRGDDVLRGLQGVNVVVEGMRPDIELAGLTQHAILTDTELELRRCGVPVVTREQSAHQAPQAFLYVRVSTIKLPLNSAYAYDVAVRLCENVYLVRRDALVLGAPTWSTPRFDRGGRSSEPGLCPPGCPGPGR